MIVFFNLVKKPATQTYQSLFPVVIVQRQHIAETFVKFHLSEIFIFPSKHGHRQKCKYPTAIMIDAERLNTKNQKHCHVLLTKFCFVSESIYKHPMYI